MISRKRWLRKPSNNKADPDDRSCRDLAPTNDENMGRVREQTGAR